MTSAIECKEMVNLRGVGLVTYARSHSVALANTIFYNP
jgi:hypothetical protein